MHRSHVVFVDSRPYGFRAVRTAKRLGHRVTFVASEAYAGAYRGAEFEELRRSIDRVVPLTDFGDRVALREVLRDIGRDHPIDALIALHDEGVQNVAPVARELGLPYTDADGIANARDKARSRDCLSAAGLRTVDYLSVQDIADIAPALRTIGYPAVVKLAAGSGSVAASVVWSSSGVEAAERKVAHAAGWLSNAQKAAFGSTYIVEPYLRGPLMSVEVAASAGQVVPLAVLERKRHGRDQTMELGSVAPALLSDEQDEHLRRYVASVLGALGLDLGVFHIEVIHTADGPVLIDPNPRLVGGPNPLLIKQCWGADVHEALIAAHLGQPIAAPSVRPLRHGGAHVLAPAADAVCRADVDLSFLRDDERIQDFAFRMVPGQPVPRAASNLQYVGHILATGDSRDDVVATCVGAVEELSRRSGVPIVTWDA